LHQQQHDSTGDEEETRSAYSQGKYLEALQYPQYQKRDVNHPSRSDLCQILSCCSTPRNQTDSPLLRLPRELRDEIYKYAIGGNQITVCHPDAYYPRFIVRAGAYNEGSATMAKWKELFDLSLTCRQLNAETKDLPYKLSVWANYLGKEFGDFLSQLKQSKKQAITTISFRFPSHQPSFVID
jgi:hypothetical protein